jgi:hypothetical protein
MASSTFVRRWLVDTATYPVFACVAGGAFLIGCFGGRRMFIAPETM